ncbi:MAG: hypothetical protein ACXWR1_04690 [Bdellovibrionota bacterium]
MKTTLVALCCIHFLAFAAPCFAEPMEEITFSGSLTNGAWKGQLDLQFIVPASVDATKGFWKGMTCTESNPDEQGPCTRWECYAKISAPLRAEVNIASSGFTSPPAVALGTLIYWIRQNDCLNPALELAAHQAVNTRINGGIEGIQTGGSTTTGVWATAVSATLTPGTSAGSVQLGNFSFDRNMSQISLANPQVFLSEYGGTLKRK